MTVPGRNWLNMPSHPTDQWAFWKTKRSELEDVRAKYDTILRAVAWFEGEENAKRLLAELVDWACAEAKCWEHFNSSEGA